MKSLISDALHGVTTTDSHREASLAFAEVLIDIASDIVDGKAIIEDARTNIDFIDVQDAFGTTIERIPSGRVVINLQVMRAWGKGGQNS